MTDAGQIKDPVRSVNPEIVGRLEVVNTHIHPLAGGTGRRITGSPDPRLSKLQASGDQVTYYEHIATLRDRKSGIFYVAFRETGDALLARSQDLAKYPEWLMKMREKQNERMIFVYQAYKHPSQVAMLRSHEDWLAPVSDPQVFDSLVMVLSKNGVITAEQAAGF